MSTPTSQFTWTTNTLSLGKHSTNHTPSFTCTSKHTANHMTQLTWTMKHLESTFTSQFLCMIKHTTNHESRFLNQQTRYYLPEQPYRVAHTSLTQTLLSSFKIQSYSHLNQLYLSIACVSTHHLFTHIRNIQIDLNENCKINALINMLKN